MATCMHWQTSWLPISCCPWLISLSKTRQLKLSSKLSIKRERYEPPWRLGAHQKYLDVVAAIPQLLLSACLWLDDPTTRLALCLVDCRERKTNSGIDPGRVCRVLPALHPHQSTDLLADELDGR